jgi:hypothetical protein
VKKAGCLELPSVVALDLRWVALLAPSLAAWMVWLWAADWGQRMAGTTDP